MRETIYWLLNIVCAVVILVLLGLHMGIMHLDGVLAALLNTSGHPLAWENMLERAGSGFFKSTYVLLLATALFHGFYGLRTMLLEYWSSPRAEHIVTVMCWAAGLTLFFTGAYVTISFGPGAV
ncbi:MAG: hypothetical protein OEQ74_06195 [Gammaproteobacteria bacterium]|nr:hypothetical protein [Gammaproteobacteria bacterium]